MCACGCRPCSFVVVDPSITDSSGRDQSLNIFHHTVVDSLLYGTVHFNLSNVDALQWTLSNSDTHYILSLRLDTVLGNQLRYQQS